MAFTYTFGPTGGTGPSEGSFLPVFPASFDEDLQLQFFNQHIRNATPDQIRTFVQTRITTVADVQTLLTMILLWIARGSYL